MAAHGNSASELRVKTTIAISASELRVKTAVATLTPLWDDRAAPIRLQDDRFAFGRLSAPNMPGLQDQPEYKNLSKKHFEIVAPRSAGEPYMIFNHSKGGEGPTWVSMGDDKGKPVSKSGTEIFPGSIIMVGDISGKCGFKFGIQPDRSSVPDRRSSVPDRRSSATILQRAFRACVHRRGLAFLKPDLKADKQKRRALTRDQREREEKNMVRHLCCNQELRIGLIKRALKEGNHKRLDTIMQEFKAGDLIYIQDKEGKRISLLQHAVHVGDIKCAQALLDARLELFQLSDWQQALLEAKNAEVVKILVAAGAFLIDKDCILGRVTDQRKYGRKHLPHRVSKRDVIETVSGLDAVQLGNAAARAARCATITRAAPASPLCPSARPPVRSQM